MGEEPIRRKTLTMNRIFIFCEGQTEETFVRDVLCTFFELQGLYVYPIIFSTSTGHKGGI